MEWFMKISQKNLLIVCFLFLLLVCILCNSKKNSGICLYRTKYLVSEHDPVSVSVYGTSEPADFYRAFLLVYETIFCFLKTVP